MRINFVTQWFPPEPGTVVASAIADGLAGLGHEVHVLTGFPNYPDGVLHKDYPLRPYRREQREGGVVVHRTPLYPSHDASTLRRVVNYSSFAISASWTARRKLVRPDVWLTYSSPATAALPSMTVPRRLRAPSYLLLQDLWPDSVTESAMLDGRIGPAVKKVLTRYCAMTYRRSSGIGIISPSMADVLITRGVPRHKIHDTPNWVDDHGANPYTPASERRRNELALPLGRLFIYAGNMGHMQWLAPLVDAFGACPEATLVLVGGGVARGDLKAQVVRNGHTNIRFMDPVPTEHIGALLSAADVQVVSLRDTPLLRATMPSKVQMSLASGRAVLAHAAGDVAALVTSSGAGVAAPPGDRARTVEAIHRLASASTADLQAMGLRARRTFDQQFTPAVGLERLEAMLRSHLTTEGHAR